MAVTGTLSNAARAAADLDGLEARVRSRLGGRVREVRLVVERDGLVLEGSAPTYYAKQLAQHAVMEVTGLRILRNAIEVWDRPATPGKPARE